ncbi:MAG: dihydropteroate synthase, partial [Oxalobacter sp.]|nr:dihydropteroate synthase [Oxalobacter sp.]
NRPLIMGILNITPDSFSDGGRYLVLGEAIRHAEQMIAEGVDIIDIGGESTRPGSLPVPVQEEIDRVVPVVDALKDCGKPLSVDTNKPQVMRAVLDAGADMINDICGFAVPGAMETVADSACGLCIMHMQGKPQTMQDNPTYKDVLSEVTAFLKHQADQLMAMGVASDRITIDPGFGFGKTDIDNITLLKGMNKMARTLGFPVLAGLSRKGIIGRITGKSVEKRLAGNLAMALAAAQYGAAILRVHDVAETVDALKVWCAVQ